MELQNHRFDLSEAVIDPDGAADWLLFETKKRAGETTSRRRHSTNIPGLGDGRRSEEGREGPDGAPLASAESGTMTAAKRMRKIRPTDERTKRDLASPNVLCVAARRVTNAVSLPCQHGACLFETIIWGSSNEHFFSSCVPASNM